MVRCPHTFGLIVKARIKVIDARSGTSNLLEIVQGDDKEDKTANVRVFAVYTCNPLAIWRTLCPCNMSSSAGVIIQKKQKKKQAAVRGDERVY